MADLPLDDVVAKLADSGLDPSFISFTLETPETQIRAILQRRGHVQRAPLVDDEMASEVRQLAATCLREARLMVEFGSQEQKTKIVSVMLSSMAKTLAAAQGQKDKEAQQALTDLFSTFRDVPAVRENFANPTPPPFIDASAIPVSPDPFETLAESATSPIPTDDQD